MSVRTDLAVESLTAAAAIEPKQRGTYFQITEVTISNAEQAAAVGKPEGHYLTLERKRKKKRKKSARGKKNMEKVSWMRFVQKNGGSIQWSFWCLHWLL